MRQRPSFNQSCAETCAGLSAGVLAQKDARVIHETIVYSQSQRKNQQVLLNVAAETNCH